MTAVLKRTNSVGHKKKKEKHSADPKKRLSMQKNNYCLGFHGNARTIKWAQFFLLAQITLWHLQGVCEIKEYA